jgi:hypothetical protein
VVVQEDILDMIRTKMEKNLISTLYQEAVAEVVVSFEE